MSTKRSVLVPEELYHTFMEYLNTRSHDLQPVEANRHALNTILDDPNLDASAKNELYNQHLISYIKHNRAAQDHPYRVTVVDPTKKVKQYPILPQFVPPSPRRTPSPPIWRKRTGLFRTVSDPALHRHVSPPATRSPPSAKIPIRHPTPSSSFGLVGSRSPRTTKDYKKGLEKHAEIVDLILKSPWVYSVATTGEIVDPITRRRYVKSTKDDVAKTVAIMMGATGIPAPPGFRVLEKRISEDKELMKHVRSVKFPQIGSGWVLSGGYKRPNTAYSSIQIVPSKRLKIKPQKIRRQKVFKPKKWRVVKH